jgi:hypothetical protein
MPGGLHERLKRHKKEKKPHLSLNAIIIEAVESALKRLDSGEKGETA